MARFERPSAIRPSTSRSRGRELVERVVAAAAAEQLRDDLGVERGAALADAPHRVHEPLDVGDAVLEQVADALGAVREQLERVPLLDVLRQHEHAGLRLPLADRGGGAQALVGVGRRHADVDDGDVGLVRRDLAQQVLGVARLADDLDAGLLEQPRDALAQQHRVVGDTTRMGSPPARSCPARRRVDLEPPVDGRRRGRRARAGPCPPPDRRRRRRRRGPRRRRGRSSRATRHRARSACAYLATFVSASATTKYAAASTGAGQPLGGHVVELDGTGARSTSACSAGAEAAVGEDRRVDAARQLAQLLERAPQLVAGAVEQLLGRRRVGASLRWPGRPAATARRAAAGRRRGGRARGCAARPSRPRSAWSATPRARRRGRAAPPRGARCRAPAPPRAPTALHELRLVVERRVVHDRADALAVALHLGHAGPGARPAALRGRPSTAVPSRRAAATDRPAPRRACRAAPPASSARRAGR